jgi:1-acyl-sn-glycerol-3-phosphate acyltransferase
MAGLILKFINVVGFCAGCLCTMVFAVTAIVLSAIRPSWGLPAQRNFGKTWLFFMGIRIKVILEGEFPNGGIIASNHSSIYDIPVLASLPWGIRWISKQEVRKIPFVGRAMQAIGCYFVARDRTGKDLTVLREVERGLRSGESIVIFPEGTRSKTGELLPMRKGAFRTALQANVPIHPVAISGTSGILKNGKGLLPQKRGIEVTVRIGKPFHLSTELPLESQIEAFRTELQRLLRASS